MCLSRHWHSLACFISLCCAAVATPAQADEASDAVEFDSAVVEATAQSVTDVEAIVEPAVDPAAPAESAETSDNPEGTSTGAKPTHKQSSLIKINAEGLAEAAVQCFCLLGDDALLAGCKGDANEIRVFDRQGKFLRSIELAVNPEAINVAPDGTILLAGEGKLLRLNSDGTVVSDVDAPHAAALRENEDQLRQEVIEQHKQQADSMPQVLEAYDDAMATLEEQIKNLADDDSTKAQRKTLQETLAMYEQAKKQIADQYGEQAEPAELTEEKIAELIETSLQYKMAVASISATEDAVFIASRAPVGYGYDVWRTTAEFADAEKIVSGLSGCCGQMDVQACENGVFVAENSRKRVRRFDAEGASVCDWGKASEGVDGFGSCCNPMNLAFGADGTVYTAEDTTGRIKRYSPDGELLSVVGAADVVPGCKKVSIGVDATGDRVYMLDITRNNIAVLSRVLPDPTGPIVDAEESAGESGGLLRLLGIGG
jgi:hypothetical protein